MKTVNVVAAVIQKDKKIFATKRGYGEFKGGWEFPGGKIEIGETPEDALKREINEELNIEIENLQYIDTIEYDYPTFHLSMRCFLCNILSGEIILREHEDAKWLDKSNLRDVNWLDADIELIDKVSMLLK